MSKYDLIVIGNYPPPIGGVSIHIKRLLSRLESSTLNYVFVDLRRDNFFRCFCAIFQGKIIHLHSSNSYIKLLFTFSCFVFGKTLLLTHHGNINRHGKFKNLLDRISIWFAKVPIMINKESFTVGKQINLRTQYAPAFLPPYSVEILNNQLLSSIKAVRKKTMSLFCTNAFSVTYDKGKREIYQITELVKLFNKLNNFGLIISDPTGKYKELIRKQQLPAGDNILIVDYSHDFNAVIRECDCMIRFTTTDGDSLSVKEALFAGKGVIATNVVDRPEPVILVNDDVKDLEDKVISFRPLPISFKEDGYDEIYKIYAKYLNKEILSGVSK